LETFSVHRNRSECARRISGALQDARVHPPTGEIKHMPAGADSMLAANKQAAHFKLHDA
jgi:hypothetical protein